MNNINKYFSKFIIKKKQFHDRTKKCIIHAEHNSKNNNNFY